MVLGASVKVSAQAVKLQCHCKPSGFRPSARWVDCRACWTPPARQKISMVSERKRNDLYVCFKRNNFASTAPMLLKFKAPVSPMLSPTSTISELFFKSPSQIAHFKQGHKKGHALRPGHHASHICHRAYCGFAQLRVWARKQKRAMLRSTCLLSSSSK